MIPFPMTITITKEQQMYSNKIRLEREVKVLSDELFATEAMRDEFERSITSANDPRWDEVRRMNDDIIDLKVRIFAKNQTINTITEDGIPDEGAPLQ